VNKIFIAFSFRPENEPLVRSVDRLVRSHGLVPTSGEILGGAALTAEVQQLIKSSDALIALLTREQQGVGADTWEPTDWVSAELTSARARDQRAIALLEDKVQRPKGPFSENEFIRFERNRLAEPLLRLSETIGYWKLASGRFLEIRLFPDAAAKLAASETAKCQYRLVTPTGDAGAWREGRGRSKPGGVFLTIQGVKLDEAIEVEIREGGNALWRSDEAPQWVHVELKAKQ
jgi:hypothetical protein